MWQEHIAAGQAGLACLQEVQQQLQHKPAASAQMRQPAEARQQALPGPEK
ncbi:MAG: hypothetical protein ONB54_08005 [candidate division KSB1 bacterium]|nr:hypothetical protein [candidate division KSB1 bacterium]MDZ7274763.1 hypothetical protein [candidate division KSB1 bacterium]MDZ7307629.1 hypothetical protein [candidate division KSB1 bacterium]MDZ7349484.1 hypothetical protein [candidate division KSB1 bacterium]MDZ7353340.1 hypothetical protein [candidate division KSB1 bacterium]